MGALIVILAILQGIGFGAFLWYKDRNSGGQIGAVVQKLTEDRDEKLRLKEAVLELQDQRMNFRDLHATVLQLKKIKETLKVEKGRVTITQAELETVEGRLRELEEIERELGASNLETEEELKILQKKERELKAKNDSLKEQIRASNEQLEQLESEIELSGQLQIEVDKAKQELLMCQTQIDTLLAQIEIGNEQYVVLKQRYDALDIEYAQLYEKFCEGS